MNGCDSLVLGRTAPTHRWTNPAERVMFVLNLALSNCALARQLIDLYFEKNMKKCKSMESVRKMAEELDPRSGDGASRATHRVSASVVGRFVAPMSVCMVLLRLVLLLLLW